MQLGGRNSFGNNWDEVITNWGDGTPLPISSEQGWNALGILEQYWPEYLDRVIEHGQKGKYVLAQIVDIGLILEACQHLNGFNGVLDKLKNKQREQETLAELRFAKALVDLGYKPILSEKRRGKEPDALIISEGKEVCIEVLMLEMSDKMRKTWQEMKDIAENLLEHLTLLNIDLNIEIYLLSDAQGSVVVNDILAFLTTVPFPALDAAHLLPVARMVCSETPSSISLGEAIPREETRLMLGYSTVTPSGNTIRVSRALSDIRLENKWKDKKDQVFRDDCNLLVIDISRVPNGFKEWPELIRRQMKKSKRFGAVLLVLFIPGRIGTFSRGYHLELHPHPDQELPASFVQDLLRLKDLTN